MEDPVADDEFTPYEWTGAEADEFSKDFPRTEGGYTAYPAGSKEATQTYYYRKRDEAIRKVAAFLKANYPCYCDGEGAGLVEECDELDEAATIVEIVEGVLIPGN